MIQDRLKDFCKKIEKELGKYSLTAKTDWLGVLQGDSCSAKHIREMYLIWLFLITEEMEKNPRFECANTMEGFMSLNCHNVDIDEIYQMVCDCFSCDGLFKWNPNKYDQEANKEIIANPELGLSYFNKMLYNKKKLIGFPWNFFYEGYSLRDIAGKIKYHCREYYKGGKKAFLPKLKKITNSAKPNTTLLNGLNPQIHRNWLDNHYSELTSRQYSDWIDPANHHELIPLLYKHGISPDIYSCTNLTQLTNMFEELAENQTSEAQEANRHSNMVSAVRCYIGHLLENNGLL